MSKHFVAMGLSAFLGLTTSACGGMEEPPQSLGQQQAPLTTAENIAAGKPVTAVGSTTNALLLLTDGVFAPDTTDWTDSRYAVIIPAGSELHVDLGQSYPIEQLVVQADNNDSYAVEGSLDGMTWSPLANIAPYGWWGLFTRPAVTLSPAVSARFIRIYATGGDGAYSVSELQVFTSVPCETKDFARNAPVTSSGYWSTATPSLAVDGNIQTQWLTNLSTGAWLQVDLQQARTIDRVVLTWGWDPNFGTSADSVIEGSTDGTTWTALATSTRYKAGCNGNTGGQSCYTPESLSFAPTSARYVRFIGTRWNGGWGHVNDFEVYGQGATCNP